MQESHRGAALSALITATIALSLITRSVSAQDNISSELLDCRSEMDEARRLACYDKLASRLLPAEETGESEAIVHQPGDPVIDSLSPETSATPGAVVAGLPRPDMAKEPALARTPATAAGTPASRTAAPAVTELPKPVDTPIAPGATTAAATAQSPEPASIPTNANEFSAVVRKVGEMAHGEHVVYLENGEVWAEEFANRYFPVDAGDTVVIKKRMFGGYRLISESGKAFRVKRYDH